MDITSTAGRKAAAAFVTLLCICCLQPLQAQTGLKPGFDRAEYVELSRIHVLLYDTLTFPGKKKLPLPAHFQRVYRSEVIGLDNRWELWKYGNVAAINLRGTTKSPVGWLENFYAAMVPAKGELKLADNFTFKYQLASHPRAAVHVGWLIGTAFLANEIVPKIDSCYKAGIKEYLIMGHSQGGAISYLLTAHLYQLQKDGRLPADMRFKTYSSASPKAGNAFFAYEYEAKVAGGWGFNVINSADWVPELPFSVQTLSDFNNTNPFKNIEGIIREQKLLKRIALKHAYKQMKNPSEKAQRNYQKYLGNFASKSVVKNLPGYQPPAYFPSNNYVRIGPTIMLLADDAYYAEYPDSDKEIFIHHHPQAYLYLLERSKY
ncbi:lipase family protein [Dyadobacter sandarakinus]|uniref:Lipase family protein n=1 Tax=Dyadobacter sandarakinus TaxID=2747268 RepID=A0ABX7I715_9BACT|nr:lipase family protein [Dyadobacter sandarakinus]QRR01680.1 lipase family protein [Dyadobacter sandarakinus]